jgi:two-component system sensor histidine kinase YesM
LLLLGSTIFLCWWFSLFLSDNFTRPIHFHNDNEINDLGQNIAKMARDIQRLLEESLRQEQEKRAVEIKMLQGQINPHFLHNTLNSIKWMAALQGADGIKEMTNCLGKLLEAVMGEVNQKITLAAELQILDDYLYIQRIRYKGKVDFKKVIADKGILRYLIVKFTLQPLVENAIFHGIEPKRRIGRIASCEIRLRGWAIKRR